MKTKFRLCIFVFLSQITSFTLTSHVTALPEPGPTKLRPYKLDPEQITVSGVSSGGYMAVQLQVAFSRIFAGSASVAGGVFWCSQGDSKKAQAECMGQASSVNVSDSIREARRLESTGEIDPLSNLRNKKVYIFASPKDTIINPVHSDKLSEFFAAFVESKNIQFEKTVQAAHGFPTLENGNPCDFAMLPWILNCNFDLAGELLRHLYGSLNPRQKAQPSNLLRFDQSDFGDAKTPLYKEGWIYVPSTCANGSLCRLHIALHGCQMNPDYIQDKFPTLGGYNEWAESNDIIVLYPQSAKIQKDNPYACWDWFGFTGKSYVTKNAPQMQAIVGMIKTLLGNP
ncbi:MAG: prolyl oligopeptidase family serine peptidase [Bdellovibrionaceae bacterium]|nr:prolyl oligopeptidase family serine peptidase [Pseudobdellovibrionaceae bacterium]